LDPLHIPDVTKGYEGLLEVSVHALLL